MALLRESEPGWRTDARTNTERHHWDSTLHIEDIAPPEFTTRFTRDPQGDGLLTASWCAGPEQLVPALHLRILGVLDFHPTGRGAVRRIAPMRHLATVPSRSRPQAAWKRSIVLEALHSAAQFNERHHLQVENTLSLVTIG